MKRTIAALEIISLIFVLYAFVWVRFNGTLSSPMYLEITASRILVNIGITLAVIFRLFQLIKIIRTESSVGLKLQLIALGIYLLTICTDLFNFLKWNIYANMYYYHSLILLTPLFLALIALLLNKKRKPNKK